MKKIIYIALFSFLIFTTGCNDILDTAPDSELSEKNMWKSEELADQGINGIYQALRLPVSSATGSDGTAIVGAKKDLGYYAWEVFGMTGQTRLAAGGVFSSGVNASNVMFSNVWKWCFTGINRSTDAIVNLPNTPITTAGKQQRYIAEAKTLRAFFYMRLNELFGRGIGVPIYDVVVTTGNATRGQSSESEVWDFIIKDLTEAIDNPDFPNNTIGKSGHLSKGTAYALRGKAYLLSSMSLGVDRYALAASDFAKVQEMGYGLFTGGYANLFTVANENSKEVLLAVQNIGDPVGDNYGSGIQKFAAPWNAGAASGGGCWTDIQLTPAIADLYEVKVDDATSKPFNWDDYISGYNNASYDLRQVYFVRDTKKDGAEINSTITTVVNTTLNKLSNKTEYLAEGNEARIRAAYLNRDPRLEASIITPYSDFVGINNSAPTGGATYTSRWPVSGKYYTAMANSESSLVPGMNTSLVANGSQYFYYLFRKFIGTGIEYANRDYAPIDEPIIRYADVLLMWAEALVEMNDLAGAKDKVKQVRDRVGMPTMDSNFASQSVARNYVRDERRREFVGEGINFFDEMRWKTLKETKFEYGPGTSMQVWGGIATGNPAYSWTDGWYTWPVPRSEVEKNPNLKKTPGWSY